MSKRNFFMALLTVLGMHGSASAALSNNSDASSTKKAVVLPINTKNKSAKAVKYPSNVAELNKMAIEALDKKQYKTCIDLCNRVLITGAKQQYATACYTMGRAYMGQKNYSKAIINFELAIKYFNQFGISRPEKGVDYIKLYTDALDSAKKARNVLDIQHNGPELGM